MGITTHYVNKRVPSMARMLTGAKSIPKKFIFKSKKLGLEQGF
jgi:hypothetical protein